MSKTLFDGLLDVHFGQAYIVREGCPGFSMEEAFRGQKNGLCGASVPEYLCLVTGLHTGGVRFRAELHEEAPGGLDDWDDIVEVSLSVCGPVVLRQWAGEAEYPLELPKGRYRVRYAANQIDAGKAVDTADNGPDSYLLQFWPDVAQASDAIVKQTSKYAAYSHKHTWPPG